MFTPRFLGTDVPGFNSTTPEFNVGSGDLSPAYSLSNKGMQDLQQTFQRVQEEKQRNTQMFVQSQANIGDMAKAYAVLDQVQTERSADGFSALSGAIQGVAQTYLRYKQQQAEAEAARKKADEEAMDREIKLTKFKWEAEDRDMNRQAAMAWVLANEQSEKLLTAAPEILRGNGGATEYERMRVELLRQYLPYLKPEQGVELIRRLADPAQQERDRRFQEQQQFIEKESAAIEERDIEKGLFMLTAKAGLFIKHANSPEQLEKSTQEYMTMMQETAAKLPPIARAKFIAQAYSNLSKQVDISQGQFLTLRNSLENFQQFTTEAAKEYAKLQQQGAGYLPQYRANVAYLRKRYGITGDDGAFSNPFEAEERIDQLRQRQESLDAAFRKQEVTAIERTNVTFDEVTSLAYMFYSDPRQRDVFEKYLANPKIKSAITLAEDIKKYDSLVSTNNEKVSRLRQELVRLESSDLKQWLAWIESDASGDLLQELGIKSRLNNRLNDIVKLAAEAEKNNPGVLSKTDFQRLSGQITGKSPLSSLATVDPNEAARTGAEIPPEEIQRIRTQVQQLNAIIKDEVERQIKLTNEDPEYIRLRSVLSNYKMLRPDQREAQAKVAAARVQSVMERIQKTLDAERARAKASQMPQTREDSADPEYSFNLPRMHTATVRGNSIITPFKAGTRNITFTSDYKDPRPGGRLHAGIDFAAPTGTPLHFYDHGVVDYVGDVSGYGKLIDIKTKDGKIHRFAHLDGFNVKKGDKIRPGMLIGKTGNTDGGTGISTGPHLHWEIRTNPFGGKENSVDIVKHIATNYRNGTGKMVRNGDMVMRHTPQEAVRGRDGSLIMGGKVRKPTADYAVAYTLGAPFKDSYASPFIGDYSMANRESANYGYSFLAQNHAFRKRIHQVARRIGIPAVWLIDVMAHESGFSNTIRNSKYGATGLIQFTPETAAYLGTSTDAIARMDPVKQLDIVERYFVKFGFAGRMKNVYAVLQAIWNGSIDRANALDPSLARLHDNTEVYFPDEGVTRLFTFEDYVKRLGRDVGRKYRPYSQRGKAIHVSPRQACPTCQSIRRSGQQFFPHEA